MLLTDQSYPRLQIIGKSFWVRYVSSTYLPHVALLPLGGIYARLPRVALLQHTNVSFPLQPFHLLHMTTYDGYSFEILLAFTLPYIPTPQHYY